MYHLSLCSKFHPYVHGITEDSSPEIESHYIILYTYDQSDYRNIIDLCGEPDINRAPYTTATIEIVQQIILSIGQECVAIIKTSWFRIFQRIWKRYYRQKMSIMDNIIRNIHYRQLHCRFPS
jgi:hypothetical protein